MCDSGVDKNRKNKPRKRSNENGGKKPTKTTIKLLGKPMSKTLKFKGNSLLISPFIKEGTWTLEPHLDEALQVKKNIINKEVYKRYILCL